MLYLIINFEPNFAEYITPAKEETTEPVHDPYLYNSPEYKNRYRGDSSDPINLEDLTVLTPHNTTISGDDVWSDVSTDSLNTVIRKAKERGKQEKEEKKEAARFTSPSVSDKNKLGQTTRGNSRKSKLP